MLGEQAREEEIFLFPVKLHLEGTQRPPLGGMSWMGCRYQPSKQRPVIGCDGHCAKDHETSLVPAKGWALSCHTAAQLHKHKRHFQPLACCLGQGQLLVPMRTHKTQPAFTYLLEYVWRWGAQRQISPQATSVEKQCPRNQSGTTVSSAFCDVNALAP